MYSGFQGTYQTLETFTVLKVHIKISITHFRSRWYDLLMQALTLLSSVKRRQKKKKKTFYEVLRLRMPVKPVASKFNKGAVVNPFNVRVKIKGEKKKERKHF